MVLRFLRFPVINSGWQALLAALVAGALLPLSLAPFHWWPLGILSIALLAILLHHTRSREALRRSFAFGLGLFGCGVSWVYVSIHHFGGASPLLAAVMTLIFVAFVALVFALPFWLYGRFFSRHTSGLLLAFPALWLLGEWLRAWLLTGFPWLYAGYAHIHSPLAGWAPVVGVSGVSLLCAFTGVLILQGLRSTRYRRDLPGMAAILLALWGGGAVLQQVQWTRLDEAPIRVGVVQPDIAQDIKWESAYVGHTLDLLREMSDELWENDWVIWPEAAVPLTWHQALPFLNGINDKAAATGTGLITGIIFDELNPRRYYNSVVGLGEALGIYHKRRLVPFGEYVPLEHWLRGLIAFFNLPTSIISAGPWEQHNLRVGQTDITPAICYELAYPDLLAKSARKTQVLLGISNLGWFGNSLGPHQFMQMGQMRALETGRYLIYSTNNGSSALINPKGIIEQQSNAYTRQTLSGEIHAALGLTPFMRFGHWPVVVLSLLILSGLLLARRYHPAAQRDD